MADHNARIIVSSDAAGIKSTTDELVKMGKVDKENADKFKKHSEERHKLMNEGIDLNTKLTRSFEELGEGIVAAFAVEKVIEFGNECIKAFEEATKAAEELRFAVTNIANGSNQSFDKLSETSENLSASFNNLFSPKEIQNAQGQLLRLNFTIDETQKLIPRLIDISAESGKSLEEVTNSIALAFEGNKRGLKQLGIEMNITGEGIQDLNKFMEASANYAGGASAAMNNFSSQSKEAANKSEILEERIGSRLAPSWENLKLAMLQSTDAQQTLRMVGGYFITHMELLGKSVHEASEKIKEYKKEIEDSGTEQLDYAKKAQLYNDILKKISEQTKNINTNTREGRAIILLYSKAVSEFIEERDRDLKQAQYDEAKHQLDLSKLTIEELEKRLQATKDADISIIKEQDSTQGVIEELREKGLQVEGERVQKELEKRKKALEELKKLYEQYYKDLEAIRKKDLDDNDKYNIALIHDDTEKKKAALDSSYRKEQEEFKSREEKLTEIIQKGKSDQRIKAKIELEALFVDEELAYKAHGEALFQIGMDAHKKQEEFDIKQREGRLEFDKQQIEYNEKFAEIDLKKKLIYGKITQKEFDNQQKELQIKSLEEKLALENEYGIQDISLQQQIEEKKLELIKRSSKEQKELIQSLQEFSSQITQALITHIDTSIQSIDTQMERQGKLVDYQKVLAEKGLVNDLAFEERRQDELEKKKLEEQKKLKKAKELETFLNSLAKFAEDNPNTAVAKALGVLAASKAVEAIYMEEGGIVGQTNERSLFGMGFSRRHRTGGDMLIHAQRGEGLIPKDVMSNWGLTDSGKFSAFLRTPFSEKLIPAIKPAQQFNDSKILERLESLENTLRNKPEFQLDINQLNEWVEKKVQNGITTVTTHRKRI